MQAECAKQVGINLDQANDQLMAAGTDLSKVNALPENVQVILYYLQIQFTIINYSFKKTFNVI